MNIKHNIKCTIIISLKEINIYKKNNILRYNVQKNAFILKVKDIIAIRKQKKKRDRNNALLLNFN